MWYTNIPPQKSHKKVLNIFREPHTQGRTGPSHFSQGRQLPPASPFELWDKNQPVEECYDTIRSLDFLKQRRLQELETKKTRGRSFCCWIFSCIAGRYLHSCIAPSGPNSHQHGMQQDIIYSVPSVDPLKRRTAWLVRKRWQHNLSPRNIYILCTCLQQSSSISPASYSSEILGSISWVPSFPSSNYRNLEFCLSQAQITGLISSSQITYFS